MFNFKDKKEKEDNNYCLYDKYFDQCDLEEDESLYKKQLYVLEEDKFTRKEQSNLTLKHKALLDHLLLEDFSVYPPLKKDLTDISEKSKKEESNKKKINNDDKDFKKMDELDKFVEDENEFIKDLQRINYLTFSPFSLSFLNKNNSKNKNIFNSDTEALLKEKEKENKLFRMINFNYDNYEFNDDLLFDICHGFVDTDRLKEENVIGKKFDKKPLNLDFDLTKNGRDNIPISKSSHIGQFKLDTDEIIYDEEDDEEDNKKEELNKLIDDVTDFIKKKEKIEFYKEEINNYNKEKVKFDENANISNEDKKNFYQKWLNKFHEIEQLYKNYRIQIERTETIKKVREEQKKKQIEEERIRKINEDNKFMEELNKIRDKALEKKFNEERGIISSNSSMYSDSNISNSSGFKGSSNNYSNLRGTMTSKMGSNNIKRDGQKKRTKKMERFDWMIKKNDNYFDQF